jgi:hypothetical protein
MISQLYRSLLKLGYVGDIAGFTNHSMRWLSIASAGIKNCVMEYTSNVRDADNPAIHSSEI